MVNLRLKEQHFLWISRAPFVRATNVVCDTGPSLNDIINCTHYDLKGKNIVKEVVNALKEKLVGPINQAIYILGEVTIKTKQGDIITKTVIRQLNAVHTT